MNSVYWNVQTKYPDVSDIKENFTWLNWDTFGPLTGWENQILTRTFSEKPECMDTHE